MQDPFGLSRKERERLQRKKEIQKAAANLFSRKGYNNTTLEEIANAAEFGTGTIYNYFPNKEEIIRSVIECVIDDTLEIISETAAGTKSFKTFIIDYSAKLIEYFLYNQAELLLIVNHYTSLEAMRENFKEHFEPKHKKAEEIFRQKIADGIKSKEIRKDLNPEYLLYLLDGSLYTYTTMVLRHSALDKQNYMDHIQFIQDVLLNGISNK